MGYQRRFGVKHVNFEQFSHAPIFLGQNGQSTSSTHRGHFADLGFAMPRLSDAERGRALGMLEAGRTQAEVSRLFRCTKRMIRNLQRRFFETGSWKDRPRSGQPRVTTIRQDRHAARCVLQYDRWGGGANVMVWAAISMEHRTPLVVVDGNLTAHRYVDEILRPHLLPLLPAG